MADIRRETAATTSAALARGDVSAREVTQAMLTAIEHDNARLRAYTNTLPERALSAADASDTRRRDGQSLGLLDGIPIAVKANIAVRDAPHHAGLSFRRAHIAATDAPTVARLDDAGAVVLGITNMDEGALGARGRNAWFGDVINPIDESLSAGGSSAGAACALAAGLTVAAIGTDTIGSVRIPAAYCGLAALKPTFAAVSTRDVVPTHHRFDHIGPMARRVGDLTALLSIIAGWDEPWRLSFPVALRAPPAPGTTLRIGFLIGFDALPMSATEIAGYNAAIAALRTLGHDLTHVDATSWDLVSSYRATFTLCELELARANRDRLRESPTDFSPELRTMLEYGASQSGQRLGLFEARLAALQARLLETFRGIDMLLTPTVPDVRVPHDAPEPLHAASFTNLASASGRPAVALPVAATSGGPPASVQLIGQPGDDYVLLSLAQSLEAAMS